MIEQVKNLEQGSSIHDVCRKYDVPIKNLLRWLERGPERKVHSKYLEFRRHWSKKIGS